MVRDEELAKDLLQDLACKLVEQRDTIDQIKVPIAFMKTCIRHLSLNYISKERRMVIIEPSEFDRHQSSSSPEKEAVMKESINLVKNGISGYSEEKIEIFTKYYIEGYSLEELSEQYGLSTNAISQQLKRMREKIKKKYPDIFLMLLLFLYLYRG